MDKQSKKDMLATAAGALTGSALGTVAGHAAADAWNENHVEEVASQTEVQQPGENVQQPEENVQQPEEDVQQPEEDVQQPEEEVTVISTEDITTDDILIEPEDEPIVLMYGGPTMIEPEEIMPIDIEPDMYGGPDMYDPILDIYDPIPDTDDILSDENGILPDDIDAGNFDGCGN